MLRGGAHHRNRSLDAPSVRSVPRARRGNFCRVRSHLAFSWPLRYVRRSSNLVLLLCDPRVGFLARRGRTQAAAVDRRIHRPGARHPVRRRRIQWEHALYLCIVPFLIVWPTYRFDIRAIAGDPRIGPKLSAVSHLAHIPIPAYYFFRGIQLLFRHAHSGHTAFLLGRLSSHGFIAYFPVAFLIKTPLGLLLALTLASWPLLFLNRKWLWLATAPVTYFAISMFAGIDIGIRHILPVYPFLYLLAAALWTACQTRHARFAQAVALLCVAGVVTESLAAYPLWLGFFNIAAGGPLEGTRYLLGSNVDWGQGLKRLPAFLAQNKIQQPCLAYFGEAEPAYYGMSAMPLAHVVENCHQRATIIRIADAPLCSLGTTPAAGDRREFAVCLRSGASKHTWPQMNTDKRR